MMNRNSRSKEEVGGIIKSILVAEKKSSTIGMPIVQLEEEYRSQDGMRIPYRALGYGCLLEFLESLQRKGDIVVGKRGSMHVVYPCVDEKIAHVSALVSGQKDSIKRCSRGGRRNTSRSYPRVPYQPPRLTSNTLTDVLKVIKRAHNGMHVSKIIEYLHDRNIFTVEENHLIRQLRDVSHEVSIENSMIYPIVKQENNLQNFPPTNVNNTNGYAAEKNPAPAYKPAGFSDAEDDDMTFEFVKKSESVQSVPPENSNQLENEKSKAATLNIDENENAAGREEENCPANDNDDIGMLVNSRTRFRLEKLIQKHPNGIWCAELPKFYHQEYCIPLNYEDLGFGNVSDFAAHLPEIFHCVRLQDKGDFKLFDAKSPKPETRTSPRPGHLTLAALHNIYESYHDEVEPVPVLLSPTTSQRLVPEGVMTVGETVGQICVTQLFCDNTPHIDVIVVDAVTPTFFWIQLLRKTQKFGQFMRVLHEFYSENASKYVIPIVLLERGLNCACIYDKKWHRGVIKTVHPNSSVTVMFYDYGTVLTYPPQDIHFLHRSFSSLPAQAIPCGLYNLKPKSTEKWPYRVCQVFSEQVLDVPMVAMLGSIDADNNSMLIALTNTEGTVDFHISDWMISSGFAVYGRMVCIRPPNYPFRHYLECKHGKIVSKRDIKKTTSNSGKIVNCVENNGAPEISLANETSFYEALLKLRRKPGKNSLEAFSNSSSDESRSRRKESRVFDAATLQPVVKTSRIVVTQNNTTNKSIVSPNLPIGSQNENYGTNFLNKLCVSHANQIAAMNISNSSSDSVFNIIKPSDGPKSAASSSSCSVILPVCKNEKSDINRVDESQKNLEIPLIPKRFAKIANSSGGIFDVIKPSNRLESGASSTSVSVILPGSKNENLKMNRVDEKSQRNPEIPLIPKRFAKLAKLVASSGFKPLNPSTNSNDISSDEQNPPKPLHLRPEIPERQNCDSEFGAIYSTFGGHGSMEPIDWNRLRNAEKSAVPDHSDDAFKENPACIDSTTELEKHWKATHSSAFEKFEKFDKLEKLKKFEELERSEELKKFEELERSEDLKKLEKFDKLKQLEKLRKFEELEKSEKLKKLEKTILPRNVVKTQFENSDAPTRATSRVRGTTTNPEKHVSTKINQETAQPVNKITKNYQEIENCEEKSLPSYHKDLPKSRETYSLERYLKMSVFEEKASKPREWNVPRTEKNSIEHQLEVENLKASEESSHHHHHHHQRRRELTKQAEKISIERHEEIRNSEKIFSKSDAKVSPTITTSVAKNSPSTNATSKLPPKKAAFLNFVRKSIEKKETLPEFGDFHSNIGGNGRMENIAWNELRKFDAPEKIVPPKKVATKSEKKTPVKLKSVKKGFSNIINRDLPPSSQRDSLCVPEGNIKRQAELSPTLRIILKSVNENREDKQLRLFIPDDIAELLKNDDSSSISNSSTYSQTDKTSAEDSREISGGCGIKSTVKYTSLRGDSTKRCSSSDTIPKSTGSESSRANDHSSRDFDSTNDVSAIMSGNANKSGEKLLKSSDTSAIASPASPAVARDTPRDVDASELIAVKEKSRSPKAEKIGKESVRKRVDFGVESRLIENLKKVGTSAEICSKSTDFTPIFRSERLTTHREDKRDTNRDAHSELVEGKEKLESPKAEKIGKENVRKRVDFSVESRLIKSLKNIGTSVEIRSNSTDFTPVVRSERLAISHREDKRDTNGGGHSELIEGEEKSRSQKAEKIGTENVRKRVDFRVASRLIENLDNVGSSTEILPKSTDFMIHDSDAHSELTEGGEKARKTRIDKIVRENEEKRIDTERVSACRFINFFPFRESRSNDRLETDVASLIADNGKLLDSDDLSSDEESNKQYSTRINHKSVNREQVSRTSLDSGDEQFSLPFDSSTKTLDVAIADILEKETRDSIGRADENNKETVNCEDFGKAEKSLCLPRNTERSSVQLAKDDSEFAPYYDDTCVVSDDEEWDFSAGVDLPVQDIDNRRQLINRRTCERIDEAPELEKTLTLKDSHSDNESTKDSRTDQQNEELNVTAYVISNIHQVSTENNENVGGDKSRSISIIEKLENNPNGAKNKETSTDSTQTSYSILSEVQKFNISATTEFLTRINSSSSSSSDGSSKDKSYTSSLMSALKQYLK